MSHLSKIGSDPSLMQLKCDIGEAPVNKPFRFLNYWAEHESFTEVVRRNWQADFCASPFIIFNVKLKKDKKRHYQSGVELHMVTSLRESQEWKK